MKNTEDSPRRDFLKKVPLALVSFSAISFLGFKKKDKDIESSYATISKSEADEIIRQGNFRVSKRIKPLPPPKSGIQG